MDFVLCMVIFPCLSFHFESPFISSPREISFGLGWKAERPWRILPFSPQQNESILLPTGSRRGGMVRGKQHRPGQAPGLWLAALRAPCSVSPETGLNGSSNAALALPRWKNRSRQRTALCPSPAARGLPSMGPQTGTHPGSRPCNSRRASVLQGKKKNGSLPSQKEICAWLLWFSLFKTRTGWFVCPCVCLLFKNYSIYTEKGT